MFSFKEQPMTPVEKPFNLDLLQSCTARMTPQCWQTYLKMKNDLSVIQNHPVRATLTTRTDKGMEEVTAMLLDAGITHQTRRDAKTLDFTGTFAQIQTVIKHPQTLLLDAVKL
jgi:hypothetical protein